MRTALLAGFLVAVLTGIRAKAQLPVVAETAAPIPAASRRLPANLAGVIPADLRAHHYEEAEKLLLQAVHQSEGSNAGKGRHASAALTSLKPARTANLLAVLGGVFFLDGKYLQSAIAFNKAQVLAPLPAADRFTLAMAYVLLHQSGWARPVLRELSGQDPRNPLYVYWLGRLDFQQGRFPQCIARMKAVLGMNPKYPLANYRLGLAYEAQGKFGKARQALQRELELNRTESHPSPWPAQDMGILAEKMGHPKEAERYFQQALTIDSSFAPALFQWGKLLLDRGRVEQAITELQRSTQAQPTLARAYYLLARAWREMGEKEKADAAMMTFRRLQPPAPPRMRRAPSGG